MHYNLNFVLILYTNLYWFTVKAPNIVHLSLLTSTGNNTGIISFRQRKQIWLWDSKTKYNQPDTQYQKEILFD